MKPDRIVLLAVLLSGLVCLCLLAGPPAFAQEEITEEKYSSEISELPLLDPDSAREDRAGHVQPGVPGDAR